MKPGGLYLLPSAGLFLVYLSNVVAGAAGIGVFLSDVVEMLTLFLACIAFVIATLAVERAAKARQSQSRNDNPEGDSQHEDIERS